MQQNATIIHCGSLRRTDVTVNVIIIGTLAKPCLHTGHISSRMRLGNDVEQLKCAVIKFGKQFVTLLMYRLLCLACETVHGAGVLRRREAWNECVTYEISVLESRLFSTI